MAEEEEERRGGAKGDGSQITAAKGGGVKKNEGKKNKSKSKKKKENKVKKEKQKETEKTSENGAVRSFLSSVHTPYRPTVFLISPTCVCVSLSGCLYRIISLPYSFLSIEWSLTDACTSGPYLSPLLLSPSSPPSSSSPSL